MNDRIDLLKPTERRYQGPVSGRFIAFVSLLLILATTTLVVSYLIFTGLLQERQRVWAKESWAVMEPRYNTLIETRQILREVERLQTELDQWNAVRISWSYVLDEIRDITPANIQFTSIDFRDNLVPREEKPKPGKRVRLAREVELGISGNSHGPSSESLVIEFIAEMRQIGTTNKVFEVVTLNSMQRVSATENVRSFVITGLGRERELE